MNNAFYNLAAGHKSLLFYCLVLMIVMVQFWASGSSVAVLPGGATSGGAQPGLKEIPHLQEWAPRLFDIPPLESVQPSAAEDIVTIIDSFTLEGAKEYPDQGVNLQELAHLVEQYRIRLNGRFTFSQIKTVARKVTQYYRKAGFIFTRVFIPEQNVVKNVVVIRVVGGNLGQVQAGGNKLYSNELLLRPFADLISHSVHKVSLESALLQINDYPGIRVSGVFKKGEQPEATDLVINVSQEQPYDISLFLDNYGTGFTGEYRARANYAFNNISGNADRLFGNVLQTANPNNGAFGELRYETQIYKPGYIIGTGYSRNMFDVGADLKQLNISGTTEIASAWLSHTFLRSQERTLSATLDLSRKWSRVETAGFDDRNDNLTVFKATLDFKGSDRFHGNNIASVSYKHGFSDLFGAMDSNGDSASSRQGGSGSYAGGNFNSVNFDFLRFQFVSNEQYLIARIAGQYSGDLLTSLEQFSIGGADNVRAYSPSEFLVDSGSFVSLEWVMNAPGFSDVPVPNKQGLTWGNIFQISFFMDYAAGKLNDPLGNEEGSIDISGVGVGLQVMREGLFRIRADIATPLSDKPDSGNGRDPRYWLNLSYYFP